MKLFLEDPPLGFHSDLSLCPLCYNIRDRGSALPWEGGSRLNLFCESTEGQFDMKMTESKLRPSILLFVSLPACLWERNGAHAA